jgi:hypothetical protein
MPGNVGISKTVLKSDLVCKSDGFKIKSGRT